MHVYIYVCKYNVQKRKQVNNTLNLHTVFILRQRHILNHLIEAII